MLETNQQMQQVTPLADQGVMDLISGEQTLTSEVTTYPNAHATGASGSLSTMGIPASAPDRIFGSSGISPRKSMPNSSAVCRAPPWPKISVRSPQFGQMK